MVYAALVFAGLVLGSFVNALVWRLHEQERIQEKKRLTKSDQEQLEKLSITKGRSMCMSCGHELRTIDLIPVVSWLWLRGRCRYCRARIPDTPLAELLVPALLVLSYVAWPWQLYTSLSWGVFGLWVVSMVAFVALALYDLRWYLLPNRIVFPLIIGAMVFRVGHILQTTDGQWGLLLGALGAAILLAGLFYLLFVASNERWIGGGDVKLAVALGLLAGSPLASLLLLFIASLAGTLAAVPPLLRGKSVRHMQVPFGPFLIMATIIAVLFGQSIIDWYTGLLGR